MGKEKQMRRVKLKTMPMYYCVTCGVWFPNELKHKRKRHNKVV